MGRVPIDPHKPFDSLSLGALLKGSAAKSRLLASVLGLSVQEFSLRRELRDAEEALAKDPSDENDAWRHNVSSRLTALKLKKGSAT